MDQRPHTQGAGDTKHQWLIHQQGKVVFTGKTTPDMQANESLQLEDASEKLRPSK